MKILAILLLLCSTAFGAAREYQDGKLERIYQQDVTQMHIMESTSMFTIRIGDLIYEGKGPRIRKYTKDYAHGLIVGDPVKAAVEGDHIYVKTPKGDDLKLGLLMRARLPEGSPLPPEIH